MSGWCCRRRSSTSRSADAARGARHHEQCVFHVLLTESATYLALVGRVARASAVTRLGTCAKDARLCQPEAPMAFLQAILGLLGVSD